MSEVTGSMLSHRARPGSKVTWSRSNVTRLRAEVLRLTSKFMGYGVKVKQGHVIKFKFLVMVMVKCPLKLRDESAAQQFVPNINSYRLLTFPFPNQRPHLAVSDFTKLSIFFGHHLFTGELHENTTI